MLKGRIQEVDGNCLSQAQDGNAQRHLPDHFKATDLLPLEHQSNCRQRKQSECKNNAADAPPQKMQYSQHDMDQLDRHLSWVASQTSKGSAQDQHKILCQAAEPALDEETERLLKMILLHENNWSNIKIRSAADHSPRSPKSGDSNRNNRSRNGMQEDQPDWYTSQEATQTMKEDKTGLQCDFQDLYGARGNRSGVDSAMKKKQNNKEVADRESIFSSFKMKSSHATIQHILQMAMKEKAAMNNTFGSNNITNNTTMVQERPAMLTAQAEVRDGLEQLPSDYLS